MTARQHGRPSKRRVAGRPPLPLCRVDLSGPRGPREVQFGLAARVAVRGRAAAV